MQIISGYIDGKNDRIGNVIFQDKFKPIYNPLLFASPLYYPSFWPSYIDLNASRVFTMEQVQVDCMGVATCEYDYILTGKKEIALATLAQQKEFLGLRKRGIKKCEPPCLNFVYISASNFQYSAVAHF